MSRIVAVIDIGKTNAKVALVNLDTASEIAVTKIPNTVKSDGPYPHYDVEAQWTFIRGGLTSLARDHHVDAVVVTTHGATAALIDGHGDLALPVMDYEFTGLDEARAAYESLRPTFAETGSPPLPVGLNLAAQIYWQSKKCADEFANCKSILTYPQYWAYRLSGIRASEATSLGCHTDLWNPWTGDFFIPFRSVGER
jgi:sugar (pentulose or hexulose) kinase